MTGAGSSSNASKPAVAAAAAPFGEALSRAMVASGAPICVGLDPVLGQLPEELRAGEAVGAIEAFSRGVIGAVAGIVPAVKIQSACYERYGSRGFAALEATAAYARERGLLVILDAKRGDIGISAEHYAAAAARAGAHAITVSGYMGPSTIEPYLAAGLGVFVLVRTSNPDSDTVQSARLADGRSVAELTAAMTAAIGAGHRGVSGVSSVGAVVGATKAADGLALRKLMPDQIFLVPGYGAQGGTAEDVRALLRPGTKDGVIVNASRSIIFAKPGLGERWTDAVTNAARAMVADLSRVCGTP